jgi:hypothetical protein
LEKAPGSRAELHSLPKANNNDRHFPAAGPMHQADKTKKRPLNPRHGDTSRKRSQSAGMELLFIVWPGGGRFIRASTLAT